MLTLSRLAYRRIAKTARDMQAIHDKPGTLRQRGSKGGRYMTRFTTKRRMRWSIELLIDQKKPLPKFVIDYWDATFGIWHNETGQPPAGVR